MHNKALKQGRANARRLAWRYLERQKRVVLGLPVPSRLLRRTVGQSSAMSGHLW